MCGGGKTKTATSTQSTAPPSFITDAYKGILSQAQSVAQTPYNAGTERQVAGFTAPQFQAFDKTQSAQGNWQPQFNAATGYNAAGSSPISAGAIQSYMDPYTQQVIDATQADFDVQNQRQQSQVTGNAALSGALGGDRVAVAQALAAEAQNRTQAPILAQLRSQGYSQALGAAQQDAGRAQQGAQIASGLAGQQQQYSANDIAQLLGIGGLQQGQQQSVYDAATANTQQREQYPFDITQWLAGISTGLGSSSGSTSTGTQTTPGPSGLQQAIGLGTAALGFFSDERLKEDVEPIGQTNDGQTIYRYRMKGDPRTQIGLIAQEVESHRPDAVGNIGGLKTVDYRAATDGATERSGYAGGGGVSGASYVPKIGMTQGAGLSGPTPSLAQASGETDGMGSLIKNYQQAFKAFEGAGRLGEKMRTSTDADSGWSTTVNPSGMTGWGNYIGNAFGFSHGGPVRGYYDGGLVDFDNVGDDLYGDGSDGSQSGFAIPDLFGADMGSGPTFTPLSRPTPPATSMPSTQEKAPASNRGLFNFGLVDEQYRQPLMAAGLAMLASESPFVGTAIGQGGLAGLQTYQDQEKANQQAAAKKQEIAARADALAQRAAQAAETHRLREMQIAQMEPYRQAQMDNYRSLSEARVKRAKMTEQLMQSLTGDTSIDPSVVPSVPGPQSGLLDQGNAVAMDVPKVQNTAAGVDPNLQLVTDGQTSGVKPRQDLIDTPFGKMTRQDAMKKGGALLLDPQFAAAGRALVDLAKGSETPGLGKEATNKLEEKQLNTTESLSRLTSIASEFKPEFQTIENRLGYKWSEMLDSFNAGRSSLTPDQTKELAEFSAFRSNSLNNLNAYIKEITGAAMTNAEADRIMKAMPNPGDGVLNGDSPTVFKAKLDSAIKSAKMALARYNYLRKNGFSGSADDMASRLPLEKMGGVIQQKTDQYLQEALAQNKGLKPADLAPIVRQKLRAEFGLEA